MLVSMVGLALLVGGPISAAETEGSPPEMKQLFTSMTYLLPRSIDPERFASPAERAGIMAQLDELARISTGLETHGRDRGASFNYLSLSLAEDVEQIRLRYKAGRYEEARYFLIGSIQNCVTCHSRRPSARRYEFAEQLTETVELSELTGHEQALIFVVTRRFDDALTAWEGSMEDPAVPASQLEIGGVLADYLTISIRGEQNFARARKTLTTFLERGDLSDYLRDLVTAWVTSLTELESMKLPITLSEARKLAGKAQALNPEPGDRTGLVFDLAASSILNQLIDVEAEIRKQAGKNGLTNGEYSEVFYLLGLIESRSPLGFWIDESSNHLEAAIRIDPGGEFARIAFRQLEENLVVGYGGSDIDHMPIDVWTRLEELRKLSEPRV